jgi:aminomethyltransferase
MTAPRATPFHARAAALSRCNSWAMRNEATLATHYSDAEDEALAARSRVVLSDISWRWRIDVTGARAAEFLSRLLTRDPSQLAPGKALKALWLSDGGGVRGAGALARYGRNTFRLVAAAPDMAWIVRAAEQLDVTIRDVTTETGGLALIGPFARAVLKAAGLGAEIEQLAFTRLFWRGLDVTISRWGEQGGYELWCNADDCLALWDRLMRAGAPFGIQPAGLIAMDILDVEAGIARPLRDWMPARDGDATTPTPASLSLESLIDPAHENFNGRVAWQNARGKEPRKLVGIEIDSDTPVPHAPLTAGGHVIGHTFSSFYSPALRRAIALAQVQTLAIKTGAVFSLALPSSREDPQPRTAAARIVELPFLNPPDQIGP